MKSGEGVLFSLSASQAELVFLSQQESPRSGLRALDFYGGSENSSFPMTNGSRLRSPRLNPSTLLGEGLALHHLLSKYFNKEASHHLLVSSGRDPGAFTLFAAGPEKSSLWSGRMPAA